MRIFITSLNPMDAYHSSRQDHLVINRWFICEDIIKNTFDEGFHGRVTDVVTGKERYLASFNYKVIASTKNNIACIGG